MADSAVTLEGDLGNLDKLDAAAAAKLPSLMALKAALYSAEFRAFVREVTGCGELADKTDCSCNVYPQGGHLLCHDDVIGTR
ncbi:PKHD-type hydroxylase ofd1, partial [Haematococcus lacustris]